MFSHLFLATTLLN